MTYILITRLVFKQLYKQLGQDQKNENIDTVMSFEIPSSSDKSYEKPFKPNFFVEIKDKSLKRS